MSDLLSSAIVTPSAENVGEVVVLPGAFYDTRELDTGCQWSRPHEVYQPKGDYGGLQEELESAVHPSLRPSSPLETCS